ncbi:gp27 [Listeria phage P40]|uniref:gp27 n=1 Tax=Listeria phage P40 TaxID=560178 RepID=UPI00018198E1|nr:gp27 [Listeria phage P40]ACI00387.1 gp27 [Listeria phage P40]
MSTRVHSNLRFTVSHYNNIVVKKERWSKELKAEIELNATILKKYSVEIREISQMGFIGRFKNRKRNSHLMYQIDGLKLVRDNKLGLLRENEERLMVANNNLTEAIAELEAYEDTHFCGKD